MLPLFYCQKGVTNMTRQYANEYYTFLNDLRDSGVTNMFGARPYLMAAFSELANDKKLAGKVLTDWMGTFGEED